MNAIVPVTVHSDDFMPVMELAVAMQRRQYVIDFTKRIMVKDTDFGTVPGTGTKPTLLKPGAEKLATFFGLVPVFLVVKADEDWTGAEHDGEPFFYYHYRCELHRNGNLIATSEGSCNSWESKYRYRKGERVCPECEQAAIIKGKAEYGGGWLCFRKRGGCGAKFTENDERITGQEVGRIANPDVADQVNTFQKMAQKRALVAAVLLAVNASEFFTQDVEDLVTVEGTWTTEPRPEQPQERPQRTQGSSAQPRAAAPRVAPAQAASEAPGVDGDELFGRNVAWYAAARTATTQDVRAVIDELTALHRNNGGPCSSKQYGYLCGLLDQIIEQATGAEDGHKRVLPVVCQMDVTGDNPPSAKTAGRLLARLATHIKDAASGTKVANPDYDQAVADAMVSVYRVAEATGTPSLFEQQPAANGAAA